MTTRETPVLLLHGFWHGAWCWSEVLGRLTAAGTRALAVDMAGHGLRARRPAAPTARPFDPAALAAEPSPASTDLDEAAALFIAQARALGGGAPVTAVAHSMGGNVLTRAVQDAPGLFAHAVYVTAFMPASRRPGRRLHLRAGERGRPGAGGHGGRPRGDRRAAPRHRLP